MQRPEFNPRNIRSAIAAACRITEQTIVHALAGAPV
jgi:hypothetical protein